MVYSPWSSPTKCYNIPRGPSVGEGGGIVIAPAGISSPRRIVTRVTIHEGLGLTSTRTPPTLILHRAIFLAGIHPGGNSYLRASGRCRSSSDVFHDFYIFPPFMRFYTMQFAICNIVKWKIFKCTTLAAKRVKSSVKLSSILQRKFFFFFFFFLF